MKIVNEYPPNYEKICQFFPFVRSQKTIVFTYGDTVYVPGKNGSIPDHLKVHERTHIKQQGEDPEAWWDKYLTDPEFRLSQEIEAYRRQYKFYAQKVRNLKQKMDFVQKIARDLSSPMYGGIITREEAVEEIIK